MKLETYNSLTNTLIKEIEEFLLISTSKFNPLFSSPVWAYRLQELIFFDFRYFIIRDDKKIIALHLIFNGYRGYNYVSVFPIFLQKLIRKLLKFFCGYQIWNNFIVFEKNLDAMRVDKSKNLIYKNINSYGKRISHSPIFDGDIRYFNDKNLPTSKWGTYILSFLNKSYDDIYSKYKRSAKKPINQTRSKGVYIKILQEADLKEYADWLQLNQAETGKNYFVSEKAIKKDLSFMEKNGYISKIFVAYLNGMILGSLGIWGFGNFVSEHGVNIGTYAKNNKIYVQDLIKDEIIKYCISNNIKYYDLSGFNPSRNASEKEKSIKFFKEKFSGMEIIYEQIL